MAYRSQNPGRSHNCGHDGHMAIMARFGYMISQRRPPRGRIILLFQPAEETGQGAAVVVNDSKFKELNTDLVFALHNLPGYPLGAVVLKSSIWWKPCGFQKSYKGELITRLRLSSADKF